MGPSRPARLRHHRAIPLSAVAHTGSARHVIYGVLVVAHVLAAVIGFAAVAISGVYGGWASGSGDAQSGEELDRYFRRPGRLEWLVLVVPLLGAAALAADPGGSFAHAWVVTALVIWLVAAVLLVRVVRPAEAELRRLLSSPEDRSRRIAARPGRRLAWAAGACDVAFFVALVVMVIRPG